MGMNTSSSLSSEINEVGGVGGYCRARFPEDTFVRVVLR